MTETAETVLLYKSLNLNGFYLLNFSMDKDNFILIHKKQLSELHDLIQKEVL
jgi:hypothetical protein